MELGCEFTARALNHVARPSDEHVPFHITHSTSENHCAFNAAAYVLLHCSGDDSETAMPHCPLLCSHHRQLLLIHREISFDLECIADPSSEHLSLNLVSTMVIGILQFQCNVLISLFKSQFLSSSMEENVRLGGTLRNTALKILVPFAFSTWYKIRHATLRNIVSFPLFASRTCVILKQSLWDYKTETCQYCKTETDLSF